MLKWKIFTKFKSYISFFQEFGKFSDLLNSLLLKIVNSSLILCWCSYKPRKNLETRAINHTQNIKCVYKVNFEKNVYTNNMWLFQIAVFFIPEYFNDIIETEQEIFRALIVCEHCILVGLHNIHIMRVDHIRFEKSPFYFWPIIHFSVFPTQFWIFSKLLMQSECRSLRLLAELL